MDRRDGNVERKERGASAANSGDGRGGPDGAGHFDIHEALEIGGHHAVYYLGTRFVRSVRGPTCAADVMPLVSRKGRKCVKKSRSVTDVFYTDRTMKVLFYSEIFADKNQYDLWK